MSTIIGKSITVKGKVQGVFFRASTLAEAQRLGVTGQVRNLSNGDVHIEVFGEKAQVDELIQWCYHGPQLCKVDEVKIEVIPVENKEGFEIAY